MVEEFLDTLTSTLEVAQPVKDEKTNTFPLIIGSHNVSVAELSPGFTFWSRIAELPEGDKEDLFIHLMQANFLGQGTGGSSIGIDPDEKFLTLSFAMPYEVNYDEFKEHLEDFLNFVEYWREQIDAFTNKVSIM